MSPFEFIKSSIVFNGDVEKKSFMSRKLQQARSHVY